MKWQPIDTAPKNEAFLGTSDDNLIQVCVIYEEPEHVVERFAFGFFRKRKTVESKTYIGIAMPWDGHYTIMNLRPDSGFMPTKWLPLDALPMPGTAHEKFDVIEGGKPT